MPPFAYSILSLQSPEALTSLPFQDACVLTHLYILQFINLLPWGFLPFLFSMNPMVSGLDTLLQTVLYFYPLNTLPFKLPPFSQSICRFHLLWLMSTLRKSCNGWMKPLFSSYSLVAQSTLHISSLCFACFSIIPSLISLSTSCKSVLLPEAHSLHLQDLVPWAIESIIFSFPEKYIEEICLCTAAHIRILLFAHWFYLFKH